MNQSQKISWMKNMSNTQQSTPRNKQILLSWWMNPRKWFGWKKNMSNTRNNKTKKQKQSTYTEKKQFVKLMDERDNLDESMSKHSTRSTQTKKDNGWNPNQSSSLRQQARDRSWASWPISSSFSCSRWASHALSMAPPSSSSSSSSSFSCTCVDIKFQ